MNWRRSRIVGWGSRNEEARGVVGLRLYASPHPRALGLVCIGGAVLGSSRRGLDKSRRSVAVGVTGLGLNTAAPRCHVKLSL
jgi:hypothetical protein